jgi:hypothetical protein
MSYDPTKPTWIVRSVSSLNNTGDVYTDESQARTDMRALQAQNPQDAFILYGSIARTISRNQIEIIEMEQPK